MIGPQTPPDRGSARAVLLTAGQPVERVLVSAYHRVNRPARDTGLLRQLINGEVGNAKARYQCLDRLDARDVGQRLP